MNIAVDPPIPPGRMAATITLGQYAPLGGELPVNAGLPVGGGLCHVFSRVHAELFCRLSRVGSYLLQQPDVQWHSESPTERNTLIILPQSHPIIDPQATHYVLEPMKLYDGGRSIHYNFPETLRQTIHVYRVLLALRIDRLIPIFRDYLEFLARTRPMSIREQQLLYNCINPLEPETYDSLIGMSPDCQAREAERLRDLASRQAREAEVNRLLREFCSEEANDETE